MLALFLYTMYANAYIFRKVWHGFCTTLCCYEQITSAVKQTYKTIGGLNATQGLNAEPWIGE